MARILVVDDEPAILQMLKMNLEMEGYEAILAGDGETAIKRIEFEQPDIVLLDIMMPALDGWQVLQRLQEMSLSKPPKVLVVTAKGGEHDVSKVFELGAVDYIAKPFDVEDLLERVKKVLARTEIETEERRRQLIREWM
ncbi:MAG: response regulator transcription factor [Actinobacteria bacterium]|nr:response regulator transcription factor [Actinomycetota bacterium]